MVTLFNLSSTPASHGLRRRWLGHPAYWLWQLAGWGGLIFVMLLPLPFRQESVAYRVAGSLTISVSGLVLSHLLRIAFLFHLSRAPNWPALMIRLVPWFVAAAVALWLGVHATSGRDRGTELMRTP